MKQLLLRAILKFMSSYSKEKIMFLHLFSINTQLNHYFFYELSFRSCVISIKCRIDQESSDQVSFRSTVVSIMYRFD